MDMHHQNMAKFDHHIQDTIVSYTILSTDHVVKSRDFCHMISVDCSPILNGVQLDDGYIDTDHACLNNFRVYPNHHQHEP